MTRPLYFFFSAVEGFFDVIIFNAPYLPVSDSVEGSEQWSAGEKRELIERFAEGLGSHLKKSGYALLVISSLTGLEKTKKLFENKGFLVTLLKEKKIPWEKLYVLKIIFS